jgi:hypothetical protein
MVVIENYKQLEDWQWSQANKLRPIASIISTRAAFRGLPYGIPEKRQKPAQMALVLSIFRCLLIAWMNHDEPELRQIHLTIHHATGELRDLADFLHTAFSVRDKAAADYGYAAAFAAGGSVRAAEYVAKAARASRLQFAQKAFWKAIEHDCSTLTSSNKHKALRSLSDQALWPTVSPNAWTENWDARKLDLLTMDSKGSYQVWIDWYERRIRGERGAFDIPGDKRRVEDKKILRRLAEATDEDFWGKGHEYVNATLKGWLDEAREKVRPREVHALQATSASTGPPEGSGATLGVIENQPTAAPPQNRNAISFRTDDDGRITIDTYVSVDSLRMDDDARDRHAEAVAEALALLNRCKGNNAAARLSLRLENYLAAAGSALEDVKPSLLVQRGEKLRQELAAYVAPDTLLDPIADDILVDLKGWESAHNMFVGLDPVLMAIDTAMLGPDKRPALMSPDEIRQFVHDAEQADLLAEGTEVILIETADLAPEIPDPTNRLTNASIEMVKNLCIETASIALNHPMVTAGVVVTGAAISSNVVTGIVGGVSLMSSIKAAEYLVTHRQWVEDKMCNTPTWQSLLSRVADRLEAITPFKPK